MPSDAPSAHDLPTPRPRLQLVSPPTDPSDDGPTDRARQEHPAGSNWNRRLQLVRDLDDPSGSLVAEYGLLLVLGATITMLATKWATGGAIWQLFGAVLSRARALVGA